MVVCTAIFVKLSGTQYSVLLLNSQHIRSMSVFLLRLCVYRRQLPVLVVFFFSSLTSSTSSVADTMCTMLMHSWVLVVYLLFAPKSLYFDSIDCMLNSARRILLYTLPSVDRVRCTRLLWRQQTNKRNCVQSREKNKRKRVQSDPMDLIGVETECDRASSRLKTNGAWKNKRNWLTQFVAAVFFCARHGEISIDGNG